MSKYALVPGAGIDDGTLDPDAFCPKSAEHAARPGIAKIIEKMRTRPKGVDGG